jgi:hypothetical protein
MFQGERRFFGMSICLIKSVGALLLRSFEQIIANDSNQRNDIAMLQSCGLLQRRSHTQETRHFQIVLYLISIAMRLTPGIVDCLNHKP